MLCVSFGRKILNSDADEQYELAKKMSKHVAMNRPTKDCYIRHNINCEKLARALLRNTRCEKVQEKVSPITD